VVVLGGRAVSHERGIHVPVQGLQCQANGSNVCRVQTRTRILSERRWRPGSSSVAYLASERLVIYSQTTGVSAAHATHCATYCTPCRPLRRAFSDLASHQWRLKYRERRCGVNKKHQSTKSDKVRRLIEEVPLQNVSHTGPRHTRVPRP